jgi:hypothetical protein
MSILRLVKHFLAVLGLWKDFLWLKTWLEVAIFPPVDAWMLEGRESS